MPVADSKPKALVVEDDAAIRELLRFHLDLAGFTIDEAGDGRQGLDRARAEPFALILLDVMLPGLDGISLCRAVRGGGPNAATPILMLTARDGEADTVLGLESGADDYLTKPFGVRELIARVAAVTRRHARETPEAGAAPGVVVAEGLRLDRDRRELTVRDEPVELTKQEFDVLGRPRQVDHECGVARPARHVHRAAMAIHDRLDDGQPEAAAARPRRARVIHLVEPLEHA